MNTSDYTVRRAARVGLSVALVSLSMGIAFAANPGPDATTPVEVKTHVLFMGADVSVEKDKKFRRVEDVTATALVIKPDGKPVEIPLRRGIDLRINEALKIAETNVGIDRLKAERGYTPEKDPFQKFAHTASLASAGQSASVDSAQANLMRASSSGQQIVPLPTDSPELAGLISAQGGAFREQVAAAQTDLDRARTESLGQTIDVGTYAGAMGVEEAREMFDAIRLSFDVTAEKDLVKPYYAIIALIRERDSKPGQVRKWAYVKSLGALSAGQTQTVSVFQGGMPPGYILESCEVHLYNHGEELATNLSRKRVALTDDEALEYRIIEYVGANKGRTLPAAPATTVPTADVRGRLAPAQLNETYYVRVARDGRVAAAFRDAAGKQPLADPALESALQALRFKPALDAGKPVESIVPVNLGQLASP